MEWIVCTGKSESESFPLNKSNDMRGGLAVRGMLSRVTGSVPLVWIQDLAEFSFPLPGIRQRDDCFLIVVGRIWLHILPATSPPLPKKWSPPLHRKASGFYGSTSPSVARERK